jgi:hypothetical protein
VTAYGFLAVGLGAALGAGRAGSRNCTLGPPSAGHADHRQSGGRLHHRSSVEYLGGTPVCRRVRLYVITGFLGGLHLSTTRPKRWPCHRGGQLG